MKTLKKLLAASCTAAFVLASCQEESFEGRPDTNNYYASVETFGSDTRTALQEGSKVVWSEDDRIAIFEGNDVGRAYQVLDSHVGKSSAEFAEVEGLVAEGTGAEIEGTIAVYPFNEDLTVTSGNDGDYIIEGVTFPSEQHHAAGTFSEESFPMAGLSASGSRSLSFRNIGGVLKLSLTGDYSVSRITLTGNSGEPLSGSATVTLGSDGIPSVTMSEDASTSVSLLCDPAVQLDPEIATDFYISIPPTQFKVGFKVIILDEDGKEHGVATHKDNSVKRSTILAMPETTPENLDDKELTEDDRWVDLGLSVLWAGWNVGASSPEEYGGYYAWGEKEEKESYSLDNYKFYISGTYRCEFIGSEISGTSYDVAHVKWGGGARMPTLEEVKELIDNCTFTYGTYNGVKGDYVTGPNGNSIFLPFAGQRYEDLFFGEGTDGYFWSGTYTEDDLGGAYAWCLYCAENNGYWDDDGYGDWTDFHRYSGNSVRPVKEK